MPSYCLDGARQAENHKHRHRNRDQVRVGVGEGQDKTQDPEQNQGMGREKVKGKSQGNDDDGGLIPKPWVEHRQRRREVVRNNSPPQPCGERGGEHTLYKRKGSMGQEKKSEK